MAEVGKEYKLVIGGYHLFTSKLISFEGDVMKFENGAKIEGLIWKNEKE